MAAFAADLSPMARIACGGGRPSPAGGRSGWVWQFGFWLTRPCFFFFFWPFFFPAASPQAVCRLWGRAPPPPLLSPAAGEGGGPPAISALVSDVIGRFAT